MCIVNLIELTKWEKNFKKSIDKQKNSDKVFELKIIRKKLMKRFFKTIYKKI